MQEKSRVLAPDERIPNVVALNKGVPESEWTIGPDGKLRGPYQLQRVLYLVDLRDMSRYTYPTSTDGGRLAICDLMDRTRLTRRCRGPHVHAEVSLSDTFMPTRFGGRQRPHFVFIRWVLMNGLHALPAPTDPANKTDGVAEAAPQIEMAPAAAPAAPGPQVVEEPTLAEQMNDELPSEGSVDVSGRKASALPDQRDGLDEIIGE